MLAALRRTILSIADIAEIAPEENKQPEACTTTETDMTSQSHNTRLDRSTQLPEFHRRRTRHVEEAEAEARTESQALEQGQKYVYFFGTGKADGNRNMKDLLGGKGSGLAEMTNAGLPVPPGFTISTEVCNIYYKEKQRIPGAIDKEIAEHVKKLEKAAGATLGSTSNPLLVSVRSGAKFSMPGMMDTILNLGLNDDAAEGLKARTSNGRFAYDSYRRFIQMFGNVVLEISKDAFEHELDAVKESRHTRLDTDLDETALREVVVRYKQVVKDKAKKDFPQDPRVQLTMARDAVFRSWMNPRAIEYRRIYDIPDHIGTAVNVQMMVFGNTGDRSGTGVGFTRNPATGAKEFYGEFLINAQGEDVVSGVRTPQPIRELEQVMPKAYAQLRQITTRLEKHYKDVQDFEFTIQDERLFMLQTRSGKRTGYAAVVIATDLVAEKLVTPKEAILLVDPEALNQLLAPGFDPAEWKKIPVATKGLPASPGAASGQVVFSADHAVEWVERGQAGDSGPPRDRAGRHPRHVRRAGHPHRHRRHDLARRRGRPPDGQAVDRRRRRAADRRAREGRPHRRADGEGRRLHLVRRPQRGSEAGQGRLEAERDPAGGQQDARREEVGHLPALRQAAVVGRQVPHARHPRQRRPARIRRSSPTPSARAASACAAPSTCSSAKGGSRSSRR